MKRFTAAIALVLAFMLVLAACQTPTGNRSKTPDGRDTFSILIDDNSDISKVNEWPLHVMFEEQAGVEVNWMIFPHEMAQERKNILLNTGEYPDVIAGWFINRQEVVRYGRISSARRKRSNDFAERKHLQHALSRILPAVVKLSLDLSALAY